MQTTKKQRTQHVLDKCTHTHETKKANIQQAPEKKQQVGKPNNPPSKHTIHKTR